MPGAQTRYLTVSHPVADGIQRERVHVTVFKGDDAIARGTLQSRNDRRPGSDDDIIRTVRVREIPTATNGRSNATAHR